jgi:hypothetical protein
MPQTIRQGVAARILLRKQKACCARNHVHSFHSGRGYMFPFSWYLQMGDRFQRPYQFGKCGYLRQSRFSSTFHQKGIEDSYSAQQSGWWLTHSPIVHRRGERLFDWLDFLSFISVQTIKKKISSEILSFSWLNSRNSSFAAKMIKPSIRGSPRPLLDSSASSPAG